MPWNFSNDKPIFQQLVDIITHDIVSGKYQPGDKLDAVRDFAVSAGVNPNTMQRALAAIEETGIIYTKRGDGRYVNEDTSIIDEIRNKYVSDNIQTFLTTLRALGLDDKQILNSVQNELNI